MFANYENDTGVNGSMDPAATATAVVESARDGRFAEVEARFAAPLRAAVSAETLRVAWSVEIGKSGPVAAIGPPVRESADAELVRVRVPVTCDHGEFVVIMSFDDAGMMHGLRLAPATTARWTPPRYAAPKAVAEHEITVGSGPLAVPGTLSAPRVRRRARRPGVVLLGGGGPVDRDGTHGPNKPLKDLAWGLTARGVIVVRFDKVTHVHSAVAHAADFTMTDEYVPHALAAVRLLQRRPDVDPARIFVVGHSMGGKAAPRVAAAAERSVAGLVILAGDAQPMHQAAVRVARYLASINPDPAAQAAVESIARQAARVADPALSPSTPAADLPFGLPAWYCLDQRGYDPVRAAAAVEVPMLILQGGRDYQVTVEDDLARWRAGLAHRADVTFRVYTADNHLFFPGTGQATPAEYEPPQHVDPAVIADIAEWLNAGRGWFRRPSRHGRPQ